MGLVGQFEHILKKFLSYKKLLLMYLFVQWFLRYYYGDVYIGYVWLMVPPVVY